MAITGDTPGNDRTAALRQLRDGTINVVFTVDLFNEGVDVPQLDTVLFLRPTESATVFLQQLGAGPAPGGRQGLPPVLDFIGNQHAGSVSTCGIGADRPAPRRELARRPRRAGPTSRPAVTWSSIARRRPPSLENVRRALRVDWRALAAELRRLGAVLIVTRMSEASPTA